MANTTIGYEHSNRKIKKIRQDNGYSHDHIAQELDIRQAAYSKLKKNKPKLTVERLYKLAEILETSVAELLEVNLQNGYNQELNDNSIGHQEIQNLNQ